MYNFLKRKKIRKETDLIFILESGQVLSAIVNLENDKRPHFLYTNKETLCHKHNIDDRRLLSLMLSTLKSSGEKMARKGYIEASNRMYPKKNIHIFVGSPWFVTLSNTATVAEDEPFLIKENFIEKMAEENFSISNSSLVPLEQKITSVKANGYFLENPIGKKTKKLDIFSIVSASEKNVIKDIEEIVKLSFPNFKIRFHTIPQAIFPIAEELINKKDFLLIIPEHDISEIILSKNGVFESTISIPFGKYSPVRELSNKYKKDKAITESLLKLYLEKSLSLEKNKVVESLLDISKNNFQKLFREALWKLSSSVLIPGDIIIYDKSYSSRLIGMWIQSESWSKNVFGEGKLNIFFVEDSDLVSRIKKENEVSYVNTVLSSSALYLQML